MIGRVATGPVLAKLDSNGGYVKMGIGELQLCISEPSLFDVVEVVLDSSRAASCGDS